VYPLAMLGAMVGFSAAAGKEGTRTHAGPTGDSIASPDTRGIQA
jgi:hypothetical protein